MQPVLEVRHLRLIQALAEEGGPTRAGAALHLTQSAVSHQLAELEGRLGVPLFTRVRRRLHLTAAGRHLLAFAQTTLTELHRVERELQHAGTRRRERLRVATECFTCYHWLPPVLPELKRDFPHVDVRIVIEATREPVAALLSGALELAIVSSPVRDPDLVVERLFDDEWAAVLPPSHPLCQRSYVRLADLGHQTLFTHEGTASDVKRLRSLLAAERAPMPEIQIVPLTEAIVELVKAGLGVGLMSRWAVSPYEASGQLVTRRFTRAGLKERWSAVYRKDAAGRLPLGRFAELLRARPVNRLSRAVTASRPRSRHKEA